MFPKETDNLTVERNGRVGAATAMKIVKPDWISHGESLQGDTALLGSPAWSPFDSDESLFLQRGYLFTLWISARMASAWLLVG